MLWLISSNYSAQVTSCNIHEKDGKYQVWVEKPSGSTKLIKESKDKHEVGEIKSAIDFAITNGHKVLELDF